MKCCATEFNLPLCRSEKYHLSKEYPEYQYYLQSTEDGDIILRGNSCPFLTKGGHCQLHTTSLKPLTCLIYPLIFWRFNQSDTLVSIHPCRGKGFQWYSTKNSNITNSSVERLLLKTSNHFDVYWGEEIDKNNPYINIPSSRVREQTEFYRHTSEDHFLMKAVTDVTLSTFSQFFPSIHETVIGIIKDEEIGKSLNSVLNWLVWSPVGLQLAIENAQLVFSIAALWLIKQIKMDFDDNNSLLNNPTYIDQLSSFYASSILPSFWFNIITQTKNKLLSRFANKTYLVLQGELPQEVLSQFYTS
ncbi:hypothetical protein CEE45_05290 [Candidatus Heimdallarchaeota archaeon B3_Heim]|nr:MAG: hypothetical protein CEE45_05290 [Candidatus Heimdallarchaeota archaeon B3_Heim]